MLCGLLSMGQIAQLGRVVSSPLWLHVLCFILFFIMLCSHFVVCTILNV